MKKWKHLLKAVMAVGVIAMTAVQICAAAEGTAQAAVSDVTPVSISTNEISGWPAGPEITSETGVLMDADSGTLLYSKGGDEIRYPASITKIMTLLLAVENCSLKEDVVFTETGTRDISWDSGNIGMQVGEVMSMRACLYALVIRSANEVAAQIAEHVGGTEQHFVDMMNEKLDELGLSDTAHMTNCVGLYDENHYCSVYDMAIILKAAMDNPICREVMSAHTYNTSITTQHPEGILLSNWFLRRIEDKDCVGEVLCAKTGYVVQSGNCAASYALDQSGNGYLCVTAHSTSSWRCIYDHVALYQQFLN